MLERHFAKLLMLFCLFLFVGLPWNNGYAYIHGFLFLFVAIGIGFFLLKKYDNPFYIFLSLQINGEDKEKTIIKYGLFYLCLVFWGLIISWSRLTMKGIQNYKINPKVLALKRPVYFIYFVLMIIIVVTCIFGFKIIKMEETNYLALLKIVLYPLIISLFLIHRNLNLLLDSGPCNKINETDIVQSFDCEEIKINKIDE